MGERQLFERARRVEKSKVRLRVRSCGSVSRACREVKSDSLCLRPVKLRSRVRRLAGAWGSARIAGSDLMARA